MVIQVENQIFDSIENKESFVLDAGAGSGKTWTLVQTLNYLTENRGKEFENNRQKIVCITYTNVAKDEIIERTEHNEIILVNTIHDFLWDCIKNYQKELKVIFIEVIEEKLSKEKEKLDGYGARAVKSKEKSELRISKYKEALDNLSSQEVKISYGNFPKYIDGRFSHDELIIIAEKIFSNYPKIRKIITDSYPIIFVDEYQDTQKETIQILLEYLHGNNNFILGFFGDKVQQIYDKGIGEIPKEYNLKLVQKTENYRSSKEVIAILNKLRSDIQQYQPPQNTQSGSVIFFYNPNPVSFSADDFIENNLKARWSIESKDEVKVLYLTHRFIAKENRYEELYQIHSNNEIITKNKDNRNLSPYTDFLFDIEEIVVLYKNRKIQQLLKNVYYKVLSFDNKKTLNDLMNKLIQVRETDKISSVIKFVIEKNILAESDKMKNYDLEDDKKKEFFEKLMDIDYAQFMRLYQVQESNTPFSTKHNTKGDEFDNVLVIIDDNAWKQKYNFNDFFSNNMEKEERYYRTNNLFYVVCSRAKKNLAVVCISELSPTSKWKIKEWFGERGFNETA
jgi:DNA helicase II / ATP-dependent DNA helicase PcrA